MNQSTVSDKKTESDIIDVKFDTPQKVKIPVVGVRNYSDDMGLELSELFDKYPIGTTMFLRINKTGEKYPGSVSLLDVMSNKIGSLGKVVRRYIELAIPKDGILPCTVVGHSLKHHAIYVEAINNVGIKKPYIRNSAPEENEIIFETTEHDKKIQMMTQMLLTLLDSDNPNAEQILAIAKEYAKICCTTLDGDTVFKVYDIRRKLEALNEKSNNMFDDVISEIFENEKDLGRRQNDVKTRVYLEQFNRILESAKKGEKDKSSQLDNYRKNLEFVNRGKLPKRVLEDEIKHLSELLAKELMNGYIKAIETDEDFATALYSLNYNLRSIYVLYTRRIKWEHLMKMLQEYDEVKAEESCGLSCSNLFNNKDGIKDAGDMWLLLIAAAARKKHFDNLPKFVDWAFDNFDVPFDKEVCISKLQDKLKSQSWSTVRDQTSMKKFIEDFRAQPNKRNSDLKRANSIFVAIKEKTIGEN